MLTREFCERKFDFSGDLNRTEYVYDGDHIIAILDGENSFVAGYLYGPGIDDPVAMVTDLDGNGEVEVLSFIKDRQNSVKVIMNEKGEAIQEINYSAYGETQITERGQIKHKIPNALYYTSRELEPETGDYFYRARFYDPRTGRFLSEDPIGFSSGDFNQYRYVGNQPLFKRDPTGKIGAAIAIGIAIGIFIEDIFSGDQGSENSTPGQRDDRTIDMAIPGNEKYEDLQKQKNINDGLEQFEDNHDYPPGSCLLT